jgi:N-acetylglucosaminyl-diphospho-decaprenol L-rhamnosyltransferase
VLGSVDLEVLVVSYNSADTLAACLASVERCMPGTPVVIREHGADVSARARLGALAGAHPAPVRIEDDPSNPGFGAGCNALARSSSADWLLFLNPDAEIVTWPWTAGQPPPSRAVVGPRMIESGDPGRHWGVQYRIRDEIARSWFRWRGPRPTGRGFVSGAAMLVDRASFQLVGGFDERYFLFYEDIDLCLRANDEGIVTLVDERWVVRHAGAHSTSSQFGSSLVWSYESAVRFHGRHGHSLTGYRLYVIADALLRSALRAGRRDRTGAAAYARLARRTLSDLVRAPVS